MWHLVEQKVIMYVTKKITVRQLAESQAIMNVMEKFMLLRLSAFAVECFCGAKFYYCNDGENQYELHTIEKTCPGCNQILCNQPDVDHSAASCGIAGHYVCDGDHTSCG